MMSKLTEAQKQEIRQLRHYAEEACGEIAFEAIKDSDGWGYEKQIKQLKRAGVTDIIGSLADQIFNDADTMSDLLGDKVSDLMHRWGWRYNTGQNALWNEAVDVLADSMNHIKTKLVKCLRYEDDSSASPS